MEFDKLVRDLSLRAIVFFVTLMALWAIIFMVAMSFNWSFLLNKGQTLFFFGGFIVGLLIFALMITNITAGLTIISKAQNREEPGPNVLKKQLAIILLVSLGVVVLLVGGLWFAEWKVYQQISENAWHKVRTMAEQDQFAKLARKIREDGTIEDILILRDALANDISSGGSVFFLFPKDRAGVKVYYKIPYALGNSWQGKRLSEVDLNRFIPTDREKDEFDALARGDIESFRVPVSGNYLRVFYSRKIDGQEVVILLDTSRQLDEYGGINRGSFR